MTDALKPTSRKLITPHPRKGKRIIVTIQGDTVGFRLERSSQTFWLDGARLFDQAELAAAKALAGFDASPCKDPRRVRNV